MTDFIGMLFDMVADIIEVYDTIAVFDLYGFRVSYWSIMFVFIVIGMVANAWWRGASR